MTVRFRSKILHDAEYWCGGPPAVPKRILTAAGLMLAHMALVVKYNPLASMSAIADSDGVRTANGISIGAILGGGFTTLGDTAILGSG